MTTKTLAVDAPQWGEHAWHSYSTDTGIAAESDAHRDRIEAVVAQHARDFNWARSRILEVGAYRHYTGHLLAAERGANCFVTDISASALRDGRTQAQNAGMPAKATPVVSDFHDLPFATDYFDVVFVAASVHHSSRPEQVLREMLRVLRPSGLLILANEPCARLCCFYAFACNRLESLTPFERALNDAALLPTFSSPFWGTRPEQLFGMVENHRIPLSLYMEAFAEAGTVVERRLAEHALVGAFERGLLNLTTTGPALRSQVRTLLREVVARAEANFGDTERMLGYSLPMECDVHAMANRVACHLEQRKRARDDAWRAELFGAALSAVVRKRPANGSQPAQAFRRPMHVESDGLVREQSDADSLAADLGEPLLPDIHASEDGADLEPWFPVADWQFLHQDNDVRAMANRGARARIDISPRATRTLLLVRYFAVAENSPPFRVRISAGNERVDESLIVLQESRLARGFVPAGCSEVFVEVLPIADEDLEPAGRVRIGVCQLFAVE